MAMVRCISLWQPWAMLAVLGLKKFETRHWPTKFRGRLAIHAAQTKRNAKADFDLAEVCSRPVFRDALARFGIMSWRDLPLGGFVGTVELVDCLRVVSADPAEDADPSLFGFGAPEGVDPFEGIDDCVPQAGEMLPPPEPECHFGNYAPGRYAWKLEQPRPFVAIVPALGRQSMWSVDESVLAVPLRQGFA